MADLKSHDVIPMEGDIIIDVFNPLKRLGLDTLHRPSSHAVIGLRERERERASN